MGGGTEQGNNSARGALTVTARVSNGASRYAMPSIPELVYAALLYPDNDRPTTPPSEDFVEGAKATNSDNLIFSFQRPYDTSGTFTLEVFAFVKAAGEGTTTFSRGSALFSGGKDGLAIEDDSDEIQVSDPIALSSSKQGTVNLKVTVPEGCSLEIDDTAKLNFKCEKESENPNTYSITANEISARAYQVTFTVKKGAETVHIFTEYINVINGLCTDTWSGQEKGAAKDVTQSMSKTLYVRGTGGWYDSTSPYNDGETATASNDNLGSFSSPLATIQKAIDNVIAINDGASPYTIYIDGTLQCDESTYVGADGMADFSALDKNLTLTIKALSGTATLDGGARFDENYNVTKPGIEKRVINAVPASGALNLTLENLVITGGNTTNDGGGIYYQSTNGMLTVKGSTITSNKAKRGGVYANSGTFTMSDGTISDNTATANCGGVYVNSGTFKMSGGTISGNTASASGGGVYVNSGTFTMSGGTISGNTASHYGGGVYVNSGTFTMEDGAISGGNNAKYGGGVYVGEGAFTMSGGTIGGNTATTLDGGVYVNSGTFTMEDGAISGGNNAKYGGGVYVGEGAFTMSGGTIDGNTATTLGGGVYVAATSSAVGTFNMSGSAQILEDNDVYLSASGSNVATITIAGDLDAASPVATITPSAYTAGRQVLSADNETIMQNNCDKFAVSKEGWKIIPNDTAGVLGISIYLNSSSGDDANSGLTASKAVKTLSKAIEQYDKYNAEKIMVCAPYTLPSGESTLLDRTGKEHLTLMRYAGSSDGSGALTGNLLTVSQGNVDIVNTTLDGNKDNVSAKGSLLYIDGATVTLGTDATLCNNKTSQSGGAVYIKEGTFEMANGAITGNEATAYGGGVYVGSTSTFKMCGGTISGNKAGVASGGGVYVGVTSSAVGTFTMSDAAKVESDNDVYLYNIGSNFATITVAGALSDSAPVPVATITPSSYNEAKQVLSADGKNVTAITQDICDQFAVTNAGWKIAPNANGTAGVLATN